MKGIRKIMTAMMASALLSLCSLEVSAQTYSGYFKADGAASDQIDSIYVTMTIPEVGQRNCVMEPGAGKSYTLKAIDDDRYSGKGSPVRSCIHTISRCGGAAC